MSNNYDDFFNEIKNFKEEQNKQKKRGLNDYNLLTTVLKEHDEVRLHSRMIGSLLNPNGLHYQDTLFLDIFLKELCLADFGLDSSKTKLILEYKNIDLYLSDGKKHIIIENKVYAGDQPSQIKRYISEIKELKVSNEDILVIYLSVDREKPSDLSLGKESVDQKNYFFKLNDAKDELVYEDQNKNSEVVSCRYKSVHYKSDIINWLEKCQYQVQNITNLNESIKQYIGVVQMINGEYKTKVDTLEEELLSSKSKYEIAEFIYNNFEIVQNQILDEIGKKIESKIGINDLVYSKSLVEKKEDSNPILYFKLANKYEIRVHCVDVFIPSIIRLMKTGIENDEILKIKTKLKDKYNYKSLSWNLLEHKLNGQQKKYDSFYDILKVEDDIEIDFSEITNIINAIKDEL